ncbi:MAG: hypothetical protein R3E64_11655 [Halioglobus sp.]
MSRRRIWVLNLVLPVRYGRVVTGLLLLALLLPVFYSGTSESSEHTTPALFFSLIIAYIIPVFSFITAKSCESLAELRPILDLDAEAFARARERLDSIGWPYTVLLLLFGGVAGSAHISLMRGSPAAALAETLSGINGALITVGTLVVWVVMTTVIVMLIRQAVLFGRLGGSNVRVSLLNTRKLRPFGRVSISSSLAVIGALALFPLIGLESGLDLMESLPGAIAILGPLVVMFTIPVWPVHRRLAAMKLQELASVNARIATQLDSTGSIDLDSDDLEKILPLLAYKREIAQASTWPFDSDNVTTLLFYLIIPPLTWAGAALIEHLVDAVI